jgi:antitoxin (DNA-binding transcriptional repressor) of toxin-antitoxin stability system
MMGSMEPRVLHVSEADVVKDIAGVLEKVRQGSEVVIEQNHRPIAVIKPSKPAGRMISDVIADLKARGAGAVIDDAFARDIEAGIEAQRQPWTPPFWE